MHSEFGFFKQCILFDDVMCVWGGVGPGLLAKMFPFFNDYRRITLQLYISLVMDRPLVVVAIITNLSRLILHVAVWWLAKDG